MSIYKGQNGIQTTILLSFIGIPVGLYVYGTTGYAHIIGWALIGFGIIIYTFILILVSMKLPEKHRKAVEGKTFLEMEIYRNKEESDTFLFGVAFHQTLRTTETDAQSIEQDPKFIEIKQACTLETEKALLEYELEKREQRELLEDASLETVNDTVETDREDAHDQIRDMQKQIIEEMNKHVSSEMDKIQNELKKMGETIDTLKSKTEGLTEQQSRVLQQVGQLEEMKPTYEPSGKNMTDMSVKEIQFRIISLEECQQNMFNLSYDDYVHALQYRLFQVRRIFIKLFSEDVHIEMIKNYQPTSYFNTGVDFERFILIMRRPFSDEFSYKQMSVNHEDYPVNVQCAKCAAVTAGWVNSQIPIFMVIHSPADAHQKIDIVQDAKALKDIKERILARLVNWYKIEYEQSEYAQEEERAFSNLFILKYDELKQKLEEVDYQPDEPEKVEHTQYIKIIPNAMKAYTFLSTILWVLFLTTTLMISSMGG